MSVSIRPAPASSVVRRRTLPRRLSGADVLVAVEDAVHRRHQSDGDEADDQADEDDHGRLEEANESPDAHLKLTVEVHRGRLELLVERPGLLADGEHLACGTREEPGRDERPGQAGAADHLGPSPLELLLVHRVVGRLGGHRHRLGKRHAGTGHRGQDPTEAFEDGVIDDAPDDGNLEDQAILHSSSAFGLEHPYDEPGDDGGEPSRDEPQVGEQPGATEEQACVGERQVGAQFLEQRGELGEDESGENHDGDHGKGSHNRRVGERRLRTLERVSSLAVEVVGELVERVVEVSRELGRTEHAQVEPGKRLGVLRRAAAVKVAPARSCSTTSEITLRSTLSPASSAIVSQRIDDRDAGLHEHTRAAD